MKGCVKERRWKQRDIVPWNDIFPGEIDCCGGMDLSDQRKPGGLPQYGAGLCVAGCTSHRGGGICRRAYLNERLHNGTQKLVVFEVDVNTNTVALDKKETDNPSTEWAVRHPEQTGPYYRCDTDLPRWCVTRWLLLQFVSPQDRWDFIDERIELKDAGLADQQWRRSLSALQ